MAFHVRLTAKAKRDQKAILRWLLEHYAGDAGWRWFQRLEQAISSLAQHPLRCGLAPESEIVHREIRHLLYGNRRHVYRILFTVETGSVIILEIRHGHRLPSQTI